MKIKSLSILCAFFLFSSPVFSQIFFTGKVTQVVDGRTAVFTTYKGISTMILLHYIEVPEPQQELSKVAKEHLETLALNKDAKFVVDTEYSKGYNGRLFIDDTEISKQMLRDGAAWYNLPENELKPDRRQYQELEAVAKSEKRGVWGIEGLKPAWVFRDEQYAKKVEEGKKRTFIPRTIIYPILPGQIKGTTYIDAAAAVPKDFAVIGLGYLDPEKKKLMKVIKKPQADDLICSDFEIPIPFMIAHSSISELCPKSSIGNNANQIQDGRAYGKALTMSAYRKAILGYRMYKVSGNYNEFAAKAQDAVEAMEMASPFMPDDSFKSYMLLAVGALQDCMLVRNSRNGEYGSRLGGTALLALNDKYGLNDVREGILDGEIYKVGVGYMNKATEFLK